MVRRSTSNSAPTLSTHLTTPISMSLRKMSSTGMTSRTISKGRDSASSTSPSPLRATRTPAPACCNSHCGWNSKPSLAVHTQKDPLRRVLLLGHQPCFSQDSARRGSPPPSSGTSSPLRYTSFQPHHETPRPHLRSRRRYPHRHPPIHPIPLRHHRALGRALQRARRH